MHNPTHLLQETNELREFAKINLHSAPNWTLLSVLKQSSESPWQIMWYYPPRVLTPHRFTLIF